jgi:DNA-binding winged helix-turn-helix (wHTH) protein/TolB-like protein/lipopolysaccharide biosynthesis regulator YciM
MDSVREDRRYRFGMFELDAAALELRRGGRKVRLRPQSLTLLALLVSRSSELVSRDEIQALLWGNDTFVDFEQGVNHCIKELRAGLRDSAESPRYIETVPRHGYRFIAEVQRISPTDAGTLDARADARRGVRLSAFALMGVTACLAIIVGGQYVLRPASSGATASPTIAVLPFETTGSDSTLGVGLAHAISSRLAVQHLAAVRTPHARVGRAGTAATETGRAAGATLVLTGVLTQTGGTIVVVTELTDVATGLTTWSDRFRVQTDELFSVENVVAERIVNALQLRVAASEQEQLRRRYTDNAAAYEAYLRGRAALVEYTPDGTLRAIAAFQAALERDAHYTLARAGLSMACADMYLRFARPEDVDRWASCAEVEARTALDADTALAEAHLARAMVTRKREFDWSGALAESKRALVLNANLDGAHFISAAAYYHLGYMEEALIELERGRRLHGLDVVEPIRIEALVALFSGNFAAARAHLEEVSRRSSQAIGDTYLALAYYYTGNPERAQSMLEALVKNGSASTATRAGAALAGVLASAGGREAALAVVDRVLASEYRDHHVAYSLGAAYAQLGKFDEAAHWLGTAADAGFPCAIWFERDPLLEPIRTQHAFAAVMERVRVQRQAALSRLDTLGR